MPAPPPCRRPARTGRSPRTPATPPRETQISTLTHRTLPKRFGLPDNRGRAVWFRDAKALRLLGLARLTLGLGRRGFSRVRRRLVGLPVLQLLEELNELVGDRLGGDLVEHLLEATADVLVHRERRLACPAAVPAPTVDGASLSAGCLGGRCSPRLPIAPLICDVNPLHMTQRTSTLNCANAGLSRARFGQARLGQPDLGQDGIPRCASARRAAHRHVARR